jgi:Rad3-related DNA helicase
MSLEGKEVPFKARDFVFFDEAHKVDEIVQNHFSPRVDMSVVDRFSVANRFIERNNIGTEVATVNSIKSIVHRLMTVRDKSDLFKEMQNFRGIAKLSRKAATVAKGVSGKQQ